MSDSGPDEFLEVGLVVKAHGVCGQLAVRLHNPHSSAFEAGDLQVELPGTTARKPLRRLGQSRGNLLVEMAGVGNRDQAEAMRGQRVFLPKHVLEIDDGQYLYADLLGCGVWQDGQKIGAVTNVFESGASDILVVGDPKGERLIPMVEPWVKGVDLASKRIEVDGIDQFEWVEHPKK